MKNLKRAALVAVLFVVGMAGLTGCKSDSPTSPSTGSVTKPKVGSTYTFATYDTDSLGAKVPGSDSTRSFTCTGAGITYAGKSDVYRFAPTTGGDEQDTVYLRYESNGDVSQYLAFKNEFLDAAAWITIPFASKTSQTKRLLDSMVVDPSTGETSHVVMDITTAGTGNESVTVGAGTFTATKGTLRVNVTVSADGFTAFSTDASGTLYFVPSIGYAAKNVGTSTSLFLGTTSVSGSVESLTSYTLK